MNRNKMEIINEASFTFDNNTELYKNLSVTHLTNDRLVYRIELVSMHKRVKLYLSNYTGCIANNFVIFSNVRSYTISETNGLKIESGLIFINQEPYIVIDLNEDESWIEVHVNILIFDTNTYMNMFNSMVKFYQNYDFLSQEHINDLAKNESLIKINHSLSDKICAMEGTINGINQELENIKAYNNAILNSEAWRITKPLRKTLDFFKAINRNLRIDRSQKTISSRESVLNFSDVCKRSHDNYEIIMADILKKYDLKKEKKILLTTHELALTGAPVAVLYFAQVLKENNYLPVIISPSHGVLENEFIKSGIPVIIENTLFTDAIYLSYINLFDAVIANTIVSAPIVNALGKTKIPVLWWIHEAETSYKELSFIKPMPQHIPSNVSVYVVGDYANRMMLKYKPLYSAKELLYYVPEVQNNIENRYFLPENANGKVVFCIVGLQEYRKGQDIVVDAIFKLSPRELEDAYFIFVGKQCYPPIYNRIKEALDYAPDNVLYIEELSRSEIYCLYEQIDCLICASRDDPMPIVATEALQHGKMLICSENTGTATIIENEKCGFVYRNNSSEELTEIIEEILLDRTLLSNTTTGKKVYDKYFSKNVFRENALQAIDDTISLKKSTKNVMVRWNSLTFANMIENLMIEKDNAPYSILNLDILLNYDNTMHKKVLLISHELSLTGAPIVLVTLANTLKKLGLDVVILSPYAGPLSGKIDNIPIIIYENLYSNNFIQQFAGVFDLIFSNTVVTYRIIYQLQYSKIPVIWWIHDSEASYRIGGFKNCMISSLPENVFVYCAGGYAKEKLLEYYPEYKNKTDILNYCVPDVAEKYKNDPKYILNFDKKSRLLFVAIGQQDERKGHDILVQAIKELPREQLEKAIFLFIGSHLDKHIESEVDALCELYPENVYYIETIEHRKIFSVYSQCDCVICSSKDDPMPVFVTEAMMMSKVIICSENTGSASILRKNHCGLLYGNNSPSLLKEKIVYVLENYSKLGSLKSAARVAYLDNFEEKSFESNIKNLVAKHLPKKSFQFAGSASIIIPTYNAGKQFEKLITAVMSQKGIQTIEITVVDSGSSDETVELCKKYNVNLWKIKNKEFTHSYARNLGAMHSIGDIFVFMTQDALPSDDYWLYNMIFPIISGEAAATSGREQNPEDTELFYKVSTVEYSKFTGINHQDKLNEYTGDETLEQLRQKASLTDVSCAINARLFKKMLYRYNYAEDLDMGVRLLRDGYRIKLLSNVRVIHGHNRMSGYYIKRMFVEQQALKKIFPELKVEKMDSVVVASKIVSACEVAHNAMLAMERNNIRNCTLEEYFDALISKLDLYSNEYSFIECQPFSFNDVLFDKCIAVCQKLCSRGMMLDGEGISCLRLYINNALKPYLIKNEFRFIDEKISNEVKDCIIKQLAVWIGTLLSKVQIDCELILELQDLMVGV